MALYQKPNMGVLWAQTGDTDEPTDIKKAAGWVAEIPPCEVQNWWQLRADQAIRHIFEAGLPEWDALTPYTAGRSLVQGSNGVIYRARIDNVGQNPLITTAWTALIDESRYVPVGSIHYFASNTVPPGYFKANGATPSRTAYPELFARIGVTYGAGDGSTTFNLPDLRGVFIRGWDDGRGFDTGRVFASLQMSSNLAHTHSGTTDSGGEHTHGGSIQAAGQHVHSGTTSTVGDHTHTVPAMNGTILPVSPGFPNFVSQPGGANNSSPAGSHSHSLFIDAAGNHIHGLVINNGGTHTHTFTTSTNGGSEARPVNLALLACIKF